MNFKTGSLKGLWRNFILRLNYSASENIHFSKSIRTTVINNAALRSLILTFLHYPSRSRAVLMYFVVSEINTKLLYMLKMKERKMVLNMSIIITDYHSNYGMVSQFWNHVAQIVVFYNPLQNTSPHTWLSKSIRCKNGMY